MAGDADEGNGKVSVGVEALQLLLGMLDLGGLGGRQQLH